MKSSVFILGLLALLRACSSTEKGPSDPYGTIPQFCAAWGAAACSDEVIQDCSGAAKVTDALKQACTSKQSNFCETLLPSVGYGSTNAQACLDAVHAAYSDGTLTADENALVRHRAGACAKLVKGPKAVGQSCNVNDDCDTLTGVTCIMKAGVGSCGIPTLVANGEACTDAQATCNPTFYCDGDNCVKAKAENAKCNADYECGTGLSCVGADAASSTAGKCTVRVSPVSCTADEECTTGVCDTSIMRCVTTIRLAPAEAVCGDLQ